MTDHTLSQLLHESEADDETESSHFDGRSSYCLHAINRARRSADKDFPAAREWATQFPKTLRSSVPRILTRMGVRETEYQHAAYQFSSVARPVSPSRVIRGVCESLGLRQGDLEANGVTNTMIATHSSGHAWVPVFLHPRGNKLEIDPTGWSPSKLGSELNATVSRLRPDHKDDLIGVEYHEWTLGSEISIACSIVEETPGGMFVTLSYDDLTEDGTNVDGTVSIGVRSIFPVYLYPTGRVRESRFSVYLYVNVRLYAKLTH